MVYTAVIVFRSVTATGVESLNISLLKSIYLTKHTLLIPLLFAMSCMGVDDNVENTSVLSFSLLYTFNPFVKMIFITSVVVVVVNFVVT